MARNTIYPKISSQGQVTLSAAFLKRIGAKKGQRITIKYAGTPGEIKAETGSALDKLAGIIPEGSITGGEDAAGYIRKMREEDDKRLVPLPAYLSGSDPRAATPSTPYPPASYRSGTPLEMPESAGMTARGSSCRKFRRGGVLGTAWLSR